MPLAPPWRTAASGVNAPTTSGGGIASTAWVVAVCPRGQEDWTGVLDGTGETARTVEAGLTALGLAPDEPQAETRQPPRARYWHASSALDAAIGRLVPPEKLRAGVARHSAKSETLPSPRRRQGVTGSSTETNAASLLGRPRLAPPGRGYPHRRLALWNGPSRRWATTTSPTVSRCGTKQLHCQSAADLAYVRHISAIHDQEVALAG